MILTAPLNDGDEVLIPAPDYRLWTAVATLAGVRPVHGHFDEASGWLPDLADLEAKITPRTVALVVINPNNPTGAVYPREVARRAGRDRPPAQLVLFSDEIYDQILSDDAEHLATTALRPTCCARPSTGRPRHTGSPGSEPRGPWCRHLSSWCRTRGLTRSLDRPGCCPAPRRRHILSMVSPPVSTNRTTSTSARIMNAMLRNVV